VGEAADLKPAWDTERQGLCVTCTRARDFQRVGGVEPASEDLEDLEDLRRSERVLPKDRTQEEGV